MFKLKLSTAQLLTFVMIDAVGTEVPGLANTFTLEISKSGAGFVPSTGAKAEISDGWYSYLLSAAETDTAGPLSVIVNAGGCIQQNLLYQVVDFAITAIEFTYTLTDDVTLLPIEGAQVWISTDVAGANIVWAGNTDTFGVARDLDGDLPRLDPGTYRFWRNKAGYEFTDPDTEIVS